MLSTSRGTSLEGIDDVNRRNIQAKLISSLKNKRLLSGGHAPSCLPTLDGGGSFPEFVRHWADTSESIEKVEGLEHDRTCTGYPSNMQRVIRADSVRVFRNVSLMDQAALRLKALRESTSPPLSMRAMANALGMPPSSYAFYEDPKQYKKRYLPLELTKALVQPLAEAGIEETAVLALGGLSSSDGDGLTDSERRVLTALREAPADQAQAVLSMLSPAEDPHPNAGRIVELLVERASPKQMQSVARILSGRSDEIDVSIAAEQMDLVPVASIDASYGMGATFVGDDVVVETRWFPRTWLEAVTNTAPVNLTWARGRGNSMSPTIEDNDLVLIDRSDRSLRDQDAIWAVTIGETAMMKRLRVRGDKVTILSDNDRVPPDHAHIEEINVVGRVSHIVRRL